MQGHKDTSDSTAVSPVKNILNNFLRLSPSQKHYGKLIDHFSLNLDMQYSTDNFHSSHESDSDFSLGLRTAKTGRPTYYVNVIKTK